MSFHTRGADFRAVFVSLADAINAATKQVTVHENVLYHFSEMVVCTNLLAALFRDTQDFTLELSTSKYLQNLIVEATPQGIFRAACEVTPAIAAIKNTNAIDEDIYGALLHAIKRYPHIAEPVRSTVGSESRSVPNLVQQYLHESEQIQTLMLTGMKLRPRSDGKPGIEAEKCFGLLIEALPDVSEEKKFILTDNLERLTSLTQYFGSESDGPEPTKDVMDLLDDIYPGEQWIETEETALVYRCRCHREGYLEKIVHLARQNIDELFDELTELEVRCGYCTNTFHYSRTEVEERMQLPPA